MRPNTFTDRPNTLMDRPNTFMDRLADGAGRFARPRGNLALVVTRTIAAVSVLCIALVTAAPAIAGSCATDIGVMTKKRQVIIEQLNRLAKSSPKGQLNPVAACPRLRRLAGLERELAAYLNKNATWCMVPAQAVANIEKSAKRTVTMAARACHVAEEIKKSQEAGPVQKLPTGPL